VPSSRAGDDRFEVEVPIAAGQHQDPAGPRLVAVTLDRSRRPQVHRGRVAAEGVDQTGKPVLA
jgi:hypothetical protein